MTEKERLTVLDKVDGYYGMEFYIKRSSSIFRGAKEFKALIDKAYEIDKKEGLFMATPTQARYRESLTERVNGIVPLKDG